MSYLIGLGNWPEWVIRKVGEPLLSESEWNYPNFPNNKFGATLDGTSTLSRDDSNLFYGGPASIKMLTDASTGHNAKMRMMHQHLTNLYPGSKQYYLAFEMKWVQQFGFGNTQLLMGIEVHDANINEGAIKYDVTTGKMQYETSSGVFSDFPADIGGALPITKPTISAVAGDIPAWCRVVVDPFNKVLIGVEASGQNGKIEVRDFRVSVSNPLPALINTGSAGSLTSVIAPFVGVKTNTNNAEPAYTTDWCLSKIFPGVDPFG